MDQPKPESVEKMWAYAPNFAEKSGTAFRTIASTGRPPLDSRLLTLATRAANKGRVKNRLSNG